MRILISTDVEGGVWDHAVTLTHELLAADHAVCLAVIGSPSEAILASAPPGAHRVSADFRLEWIAGGLEDVRPAARWLCGVAREWRADVLHLNQLTYAAEPLGRPTLVVAHSDVLSWWSEVRREPLPPDWRPYAEAVGRGLGAADIVVAPSGYQSDLLRTHYGLAAVRVVWNGTTPPSSARPPRAEPLRFLTSGRAWDPAKGMATLDAALGLLGRDAPEVHLLGATSHAQGSSFEPTRLTAQGRVSRPVMDRWLDDAAVYIAPSLYEPFGLAPLEAALRGCALALSDIGSFRELWHGCAEFFDAGDPESLAAALRRLLRDPERRRGLAAAAGARALDRFTAARMAAEYTRTYAQLLEASVCA